MSTRVSPQKNHQNLNFVSTFEPESLLERYRQVRAVSERICEPLETEDYVVQSMEDASPTKWHLAHTSWFFETFVLGTYDEQYEPRHPEYGFLFNSYYVQAGDRYPRPGRGLVTRPGVQEVMDYRHHLDECIEECFRRVPPDRQSSLMSVVEVGIQHEQQHQELMLTDIKHLFSFNPLHPCYRGGEKNRPARPAPLKWLHFAEGVRTVGSDGQGFCFDNEMPRHRVFLEDFEIADRLVTNGEFMEFMGDGGYRRPNLWLSEGWNLAEAQRWQAPLYWQENSKEWQYFTLNGLRPVDPHEPVCHLSYFEADAFARWAGARLPRESEWEVAAENSLCRGNLLDQENYHPVALDTRLADSPSQVFGDVWEWTQSPYLGYPGYQPLEGVLGEYNGKFMCNQMVLRGGSCVTPQSHIRRTYRNFFPTSARWQFSGLRLARDIQYSQVFP